MRRRKQKRRRMKRRSRRTKRKRRRRRRRKERAAGGGNTIDIANFVYPVIRELKQTTTSTATRTPPNKGFS